MSVCHSFHRYVYHRQDLDLHVHQLWATRNKLQTHSPAVYSHFTWHAVFRVYRPRLTLLDPRLK